MTCKLSLAARGTSETCPGNTCAFWDGGCIIDRMTIDLRSPNLAAYLLELREQLGEARGPGDDSSVRSQFARRIGLEL